MENKRRESRATSKAALLLFYTCTRLYRVTVHVTVSVSDGFRLVNEKAFSKTITPPADFVKRADVQILLVATPVSVKRFEMV